MDRHHPVPLIDGHVLNVVGAGDPRIVDKNVNAAERGDAALDQLCHLTGFADVGLDSIALASRRSHLFGDLLGRFLLLRRWVVDDYVGALARESKRDARANSRTAARHKRSFVLELPHISLRVPAS